MSGDEFAPALGSGVEEYAEAAALPCRDCGPGYRIGGEGCRHGDSYQPELGETGVCRTCAQPIWWELGEVGGRERLGWSDRITRGGDSVVCFKAVGYRHVPMGGREAAIYAAGLKAGQEKHAAELEEKIDHEALVEWLENALVAYDEDGRVFGTSGAGASFLAEHLAPLLAAQAVAAQAKAAYHAMWSFYLRLPFSPFSDMVQREAMRLKAEWRSQR